MFLGSVGRQTALVLPGIMQAADHYRNEKLAILATITPAARGRRHKTRTIAGESHGRYGPQDQRRRHQSPLQLGPGAAGARHHGGRFRGTRRLPPPAPLPAEPGQAGAGKIRARRAARVRRQQYPLHHLDQDRRVGARQALPLGAADPRRRSHPVGLRLGRRAPQALYALAQAGELQGRPHRPARHRQSGIRADGAPRQGDRSR